MTYEYLSSVERCGIGVLNMPTDVPGWHEVLGVRPGATRDEILAAYRRHSKTCHPDSGGNPGLFRLLTIARDELLDASESADKPSDPQSDEAATTAGSGLGTRVHDPNREYSPRYQPSSRGLLWRGVRGIHDLLARLPTPRTRSGWAIVVFTWMVVAGTIDSLSENGPVAILMLTVLPILIAANRIRAKQQRQAWEYFESSWSQWR
jgi:DnaJ domain